MRGSRKQRRSKKTNASAQPSKKKAKSNSVERKRSPVVQEDPQALTAIHNVVPTAKSAKKPSKLIPEQSAENRGKLTVVLDLDETLIFGRAGPIMVRPGAQRLLQRLKHKCELVVWTAADVVYASEVLLTLDPDGSAIDFLISRTDAWFDDKAATVIHPELGAPLGAPKNLRLLGRPLHRTIIVEDSPSSVVLQPKNAILVGPYRGEPGDTTLHKLLRVIEATVDKYAEQCNAAGEADDDPRHHVGDLVAAHPHIVRVDLTNRVDRISASTLGLIK